MLTIHRTVTVPESRQITLTMPPETPVGEVELTITATVTADSDETSPGNPDTPEFREMVERSHHLAVDLRDWLRHLKQLAIQDGRDPSEAIPILTPTEANRKAFNVWRQSRRTAESAV
jgi:hypothetical protein